MTKDALPYQAVPSFLEGPSTFYVGFMIRAYEKGVLAGEGL